MLDDGHTDFADPVDFVAGVSLARAANQVFTPQQYKYSTFNAPPGFIDVCGTRVRLFNPPVEPEQLELDLPTAPEINKWRDLSCSSHMRPYLTAESLQESLELAERVLATCHQCFDTIAFRGMSGAFLGPPLAMRFHKGMVMIRKDSDDSHSSMVTEGFTGCNHYVIVDDFVSTKNTINRIIDTIYNKIGPETVCVGVLQVEYLTQKSVHGIECGKKEPFDYMDYVAERVADLKAKQDYKKPPTPYNFWGKEMQTTAITLYRTPRGALACEK
jgi:adenine/guanine phosphoribosyltransferase-like PRPP-binding protein